MREERRITNASSRSSSQQQARRRRAERAGQLAEIWAALYLTMKGYGLIARRVHTPAGEIDLVMKKRGLVIFVEVKKRIHLDDAGFVITARARERLARAAQAWLARHPGHAQGITRLDALYVSSFGLIRHIPNI